MAEPLIHIFIGTKAQYIKTAPLIRLLDTRRTPYRLIDSGQHAALTEELRAELAVREPDFRLGGDQDITTIPAMLRWAGGVLGRLFRRSPLRQEVFGGHGGICVVHGDTPSTLLSALLARRAGLRVAHIEAGLRSHSIRHPFPEELIRLIVMRISHILFAPDEAAEANLRSMRVRGRVIRLSANTNVEALARSLPTLPQPSSGPVVATTHRVENLKHGSRLEEFVRLVGAIAETRKVRFVVHGPTQVALEAKGLLTRLGDSRLEIAPLQSHSTFTRMLAAAPFVITDGGSIQEECALLGVPTLLWRTRTEREDGLGRNVLISKYDSEIVDGFLASYEDYRRPPSGWDAKPSAEIAKYLAAELSALSQA